MDVLILGSGGREHALARKILKDLEGRGEVFVCPGNAGMSRDRQIQLIAFGSVLNLQGIKDILKKNPKIKVVIPGPETIIDLGVKNYLESLDVLVFCPSKNASKLESSKVFSKVFAQKYDLPTAKGYSCNSETQAKDIIKSYYKDKKNVIKLDGLAAGKGVYLPQNIHESLEIIENIYKKNKEERILIEDCILGRELSVFFICHEQNYKYIGHARDYKRLFEGDLGPNTGGMGCVLEKQDLSEMLLDKICSQILEPTLKGMSQEGKPYSGFLFIGLMVKEENPSLIEFNVRMGDPESQTILPNLKINLLNEIQKISTAKNLIQDKNRDIFHFLNSIHVVMSSKNYAQSDLEMKLYKKLHVNDSVSLDDLFFAGVAFDKNDNSLVNSGGRVLGITKIGESLKLIRERCYQDISKVSFEGAYYRRDIGE